MIICIREPLVDILVSIATEVYGSCVSTNKSCQKVLLVQCLNTVYGTIVAALLYYKKFVKSHTKQGYMINPYDGCMANKVIKGKQITICCHIDDCNISHKLNTKSSTESELVGVDDMMLIIIWTRYFLLEQGYGD